MKTFSKLFVLVELSVVMVHISASVLPLQAPLHETTARAVESDLSTIPGVSPLVFMVIIITGLAISFFAIAGSYLYALFEDTPYTRALPSISAAPGLPSYAVWANAFYHIKAYFILPITGQRAAMVQVPRRTTRTLLKIKYSRPVAGVPAVGVDRI